MKVLIDHENKVLYLIDPEVTLEELLHTIKSIDPEKWENWTVSHEHVGAHNLTHTQIPVFEREYR